MWVHVNDQHFENQDTENMFELLVRFPDSLHKELKYPNNYGKMSQSNKQNN
jgi:hypothetical protein